MFLYCSSSDCKGPWVVHTQPAVTQGSVHSEGTRGGSALPLDSALPKGNVKSLSERQLTEQSLSLHWEVCSYRGMYMRLPNWYHLIQLKAPRAVIIQRRKKCHHHIKSTKPNKKNKQLRLGFALLKKKTQKPILIPSSVFLVSSIQYVQNNLRLLCAVPTAVLTENT